MTSFVLVILGVSIGAPLIRSWAWHVPLSMFSWGMVLRSSLSAALFSFLVGMLMTLVFSTTNAAFIAGGVGMAMVILNARNNRFLRGVALLSWRLTQPESREEAEPILHRRLRELATSLSPAHYAKIALFASVPLTALGAWKKASVHLQAIDGTLLQGETRERVYQALAAVYLQTGQLEKAQSAIDSIERPATNAIERWLDAMEALLLAIRGAADEALIRVIEIPTEDLAIASIYRVVRAHALACKGDIKGAKSTLQKAQEEVGSTVLEQAIRPVGPATEIARTMLNVDRPRLEMICPRSL